MSQTQTGEEGAGAITWARLPELALTETPQHYKKTFLGRLVYHVVINANPPHGTIITNRSTWMTRIPIEGYQMFISSFLITRNPYPVIIPVALRYKNGYVGVTGTYHCFITNSAYPTYLSIEYVGGTI